MYPEIRDYFESLPAYIENAFDLKDEDSLIDLGLVDSLGLLDFIAFLEKTFDIELEPEDLVRGCPDSC